MQLLYVFHRVFVRAKKKELIFIGKTKGKHNYRRFAWQLSTELDKTHSMLQINWIPISTKHSIYPLRSLSLSLNFFHSFIALKSNSQLFIFGKLTSLVALLISKSREKNKNKRRAATIEIKSSWRWKIQIHLAERKLKQTNKKWDIKIFIWCFCFQFYIWIELSAMWNQNKNKIK